MAEVYYAWAESRINVSGMGGCLEICPGFIHWYSLSRTTPVVIAGVNQSMIDTMGYAFTFHVVSILTGAKVGAYVHYPTISTEMIRRVESRVALHNNSASVSSSTFLTRAKLL